MENNYFDIRKFSPEQLAILAASQPKPVQNNTNISVMGTSILDLKKQEEKMYQRDEREKQDIHNGQNNESAIKNAKRNSKIQNLVNSINKKLDDYEPSKPTQQNTDSDEDFIEKNIKKDYESQIVKRYFKEPLLIVVIYLILSQEFVRNNIGKYITYINPDENGNVSNIGFCIYGLILAVLVVFFKVVFKL